MNPREKQIAEFRANSELTEFVWEWLDDFLSRLERLDPKTALIELAAMAMREAILEDGTTHALDEEHDMVHDIAMRILDRCRDLCAEIAAEQ